MKVIRHTDGLEVFGLLQRHRRKVIRHTDGLEGNCEQLAIAG